MNLSTFLISAALFFACAWIVRSMIQKKRRGQCMSSCSGSCRGCAHASNLPDSQSENPSLL